MSIRCLIGIVSSVVLVAQVHADPITLRPAMAPGMTWTFSQSQSAKSENKATMNGMTQPFTTINSGRRSGKIEVLQVEAGEPTSLRVTFGNDCDSSMEMVGQGRQSMPFPLAGKTVTISRVADGRVTDDFRDGQLDPQSQSELHGMLETGSAIYPKQPVDVGQEWDADPQAVSRMMQLRNANDRAGMRLKLLSVKDIDGRQTAEVKVSTAVEMEQNGLSIKTILQGVALVDIATGHTVKTDLTGSINTSGQQQNQTPDGNAMTYQVEGIGTMTIANTAPITNAPTGAPVPVVAAPRPVVEGNDDNPLAANPLGAAATPVDPLVGSYSDGKLKLDLTGGDGSYKGTVTLGSNTFPVTVKLTGGTKLDGSFTAGGNSFPFTATVGDNSMKFETGGTLYSLKKAAKPVGPVNPLGPQSRRPADGGVAAANVAPVAPAQPEAPKPAPVALRQYNFPDGTGSIGLAEGWTTDAASCQSVFVVAGPGEQKLSVGFAISVNTPDSQTVRMQREMEQNARQWGMALPQTIPMIVAPYSAPADALQTLVPQFSQFSQRNGGPATQVGNIKLVQTLKSGMPNGQGAVLAYDVRKQTPGRGAQDFRALSNVQTTPLSHDAWMFYAIEAMAPTQTFDSDLPVMLQMLNSWKINEGAMAQKTRDNIDNSNRTFAAGQAAHRDRMAAFDSYNKSWADRQKSQDGSHADFIETIRGTRTVEDTRTGERRDADLGHSKDIVDTLNQPEPDRFREVPLRDQ